MFCHKLLDLSYMNIFGEKRRLNMGALAQVVPWIPEEDLLLKNAIEVELSFPCILFPFFVAGNMMILLMSLALD